MTTTFDAIVIGTGQAGPSLARRLAGSGCLIDILPHLFRHVAAHL